MIDTVIIRQLECQDYQTCWQAMRRFTDQRDSSTPDEIWLLEHFPVFTQGQNGKPEHILNPGNIPIVQTDRGGQVTYHGPGQLVIYTLIDLSRKKLNIRELVSLLENAMIDTLAAYRTAAVAKCDAPGVYVNHSKIGSVGLRIRRGCSYHGLAFNVKMDLEPFLRIHPCGYPKLKMTQLSDLIGDINIKEIEMKFVNYLVSNLGYTTCLSEPRPLGSVTEPTAFRETCQFSDAP